MKTLLILRHAKSSWADDDLPDHDRPLKARGERDAPRMGRLLKREGLVPQLILSSTAKRAIDTAKLAAEGAGYAGAIRLTRNFYHGDPEDYAGVLCTLEDVYDVVMVVGHNPGLEMLVEQLTGEPERMPTAALAQVALPITAWQAFDEFTEGELLNLWVPREVE